MVDGILAMIPAAKVGHIGLYRDPKTLAARSSITASCLSRHRPSATFVSRSDACNRRFRVAAQSTVHQAAAACKHIKLMCIIGCAGRCWLRLQKDHPDVEILRRRTLDE